MTNIVPDKGNGVKISSGFDVWIKYIEIFKQEEFRKTTLKKLQRLIQKCFLFSVAIYDVQK